MCLTVPNLQARSLILKLPLHLVLSMICFHGIENLLSKNDKASMCQNEIQQKPGLGLIKEDGLLWRQDVFKGGKDVNGEMLLGKKKKMKNDPVMEHFKLEISGKAIAECIISWYHKMLNLAEIDQQIIWSIWRRPTKAAGWEQVMGEHGCTMSGGSGLDRALAHLQIFAAGCSGRGSRNAVWQVSDHFSTALPVSFQNTNREKGATVCSIL